MIITTKDGSSFDTQTDLTAPERHILQKLFLWKGMATSIQQFREKKEEALHKGWNGSGRIHESPTLKSIIEDLEHARARDAHIYAEVLGSGVSNDAFNMIIPDPEGEGAALAIHRALEDANVSIEDIDYINAHGTSTPLGDLSETKAIKSVFGNRAYDIPISSTKSMIGHLMGAAGAIEAVVCIMTMIEGIIHPTINLDTPDPDCDLDYVPNETRDGDIKVVLSNSFGLGGQNACLILSRF